MPKPLPELLADLRAEPSEGVLRNVLSDLKEYDNRPLRLLAAGVEEELRGPVADPAARDRLVRARILEVEQAIAAQVGEGPGLRRPHRLEIPPRQLVFGGYTNVFRTWREEYIPVRNDPQMGPQIQTRILMDLQTMYNDAAIAIDAGDHVSPPQQVVFDAYQAVIAPITGDSARTPGDVLRMLTVLENHLPTGPGGKRRSQTKRFGSCVKAVRKTVKARKGSNPESAAIAICTKTLLHPRGRTIKRYRKGRLTTQKRRV